MPDLTWYLVESYSGRSYRVLAKTRAAAVRLACKYDGVRPSDSWCGMSNYKAHKMTLDEIAEHEGVFVHA